MLDFARLLPQAALRLPLLKVHYAVMEKYNQRLANQSEDRGNSYSNVTRAREPSAGALVCCVGDLDTQSLTDALDFVSGRL